ncbi:disease resistance protein RGA2-like [Rosa rugosa]|uniref:disease resistance protein RGA2-like n=1 Tax=Rosa rugosa TaxID=74645 RepID=UPI002B411D0B|nr:disease resistance protein RGA2-like [Rosa rugosa]
MLSSFTLVIKTHEAWKVPYISLIRIFKITKIIILVRQTGKTKSTFPLTHLNNMAELVLDLASKLTERLGSLAYNEICLAWGVKTDLQKLERTISTIKNALDDAEEKQVHNKGLQSALQQLKDVFRDAEDVLDEFECEALRRQVVKTYYNTARKVRRFFSRSNPIAFRLRVGHEITEIRERLDELIANKAIFDHLTDHQGDLDHDRNVRSVNVRRENMTHSFIPASEVIGRDSDKEVIVDLLMPKTVDQQSGNSQRIVSIIPIVGIGGLGKTTLAKLVYNDERIVGNFDLRMWVYVSVDFDIHRLMEKILSSALGTEISEKMSVDQLQAKLRESLKDKKYLLVLDDVWNEDRIQWSELRNLLIDGIKLGSKILVTTRNHSVASIMGTVQPYNLAGLSYEHCLSLFRKSAFKEGDEKQHPHLFEIGKEIVKKCGGAPLAVRTLGSQLYSETDERRWKLVRDSKIWELEREGSGHILPALRLSYTQLPSYLKPCLAYCAYLPKKGLNCNSLELIHCWMAHGILQSRDNENLEMEEVGEQYFKELWARSFFENVETVEDEFDLYYKFSMHDLIYDLVQSIGQDEWSVVDSSTKDIVENVRHLSFLEFDNILMVPTILQKLKKVRSITTVKEVTIDESFLDTCFSKFKYLRVLRFVELSLELPSSIGALKHLRYLYLEEGEMTKLPNAICKLQSLQILFFSKCENIEELPRDMGNLISLRLLMMTTKEACFQDNGVGCLKSLRLLAIVNCGNLISLPREMNYLSALRTLILADCEQLDLVTQHYKAIPLRLEKLAIDGLPRITELPEWFRGAANTLQYLWIEDCSNLGSLPGWLTDLTSLKKLVLKRCPKLLSLPEGMDRLTALRDLKIVGCPELQRRCERDTGEDWPKIARIPNIYISNW